MVINSTARDVPVIETIKGGLQCLISDGLRVAPIIGLPIINLWLPSVLRT